ncbi:MAG: tryptophan 7-halogenase, partial [Saprospiraceae bacterium]|nr:tryptophan 7-halogenase [Saprospiraceae bacterium]
WGDHVRSVRLSDFGFDRPALHVERAEFDDILFKNAQEKGVDTFENTLAQEIETVAPGVSKVHYTSRQGDSTDKGTFNCKFVIDSTGQATLMGKQKDMKVFDDGFRFHAFWAYYKEMDYMSSLDRYCRFSERRTHFPQTLVTDEGEWGWIWQIVMKDSVSVGLILERENMNKFKEKGKDLKSRFLRTIRENDILSNFITTEDIVDDKIYSVRDYSYKTKEHAVGNTVLVGDAAAFVDPINSAGVIMAFYSGYFASWVLDKSLQSPDKAKSYFDFYQKIVSSKFNLFRAIAVPEKYISQETLAACQQAFRLLSENELQLLMTQISLTQRAENVPEFVSKLGVDKEYRFDEMSRDSFLSNFGVNA